MEEKEPKLHILNSQMLSKDQKRLFWAERTIEKFKEYDKKRTEYVHKLEQNYQTLRKRYEELEEELYGDDKEALSKREKTRNKKIEEYNRIMRGEHALQVMQKKYMIDGEYTDEYSAFLSDFKAAMAKEFRDHLIEKNKKLTRNNESLLCELVKYRMRIKELEEKCNNSK